MAKRIKNVLADIDEAKLYARFEGFDDVSNPEVELIVGSIYDWTYECQKQKKTLIFVGAMGIAVRAISAGIENKLTDAPVLVVDELGTYVIPVLGGHMGGANQLAMSIATQIGSIPVITTATDIEGKFSVDLYAKENNLSIYNKDGIAKVSSKALEGKPIRLSIEDFPPQETDVIITSDKSMLNRGTIGLCPKIYSIGIGCKKDTSVEKLEGFLLETLSDVSIDISDVGAIGSIDIKAEEMGILELSRRYNLPFITFSAGILMSAKGEYEESSFVKEQTGVGNVCERAAMLLTSNSGTIILNKRCKDGMTIAIAKMGK